MRLFLVVLLHLAFSMPVAAQFWFVLQPETHLHLTEIRNRNAAVPVSTFLRPFVVTDSALAAPDSIYCRYALPWWRQGRSPRFPHMLRYESTEFGFRIDPLVFFDLQYDLRSESWLRESLITTNSRGVMIEGHLDKKLRFYTEFTETQAFFPDFADLKIRQRVSVAGYGVPKKFGSPQGDAGAGHDFYRFSAQVAWKPSEFWLLQAGHGRFFAGYGFQSLILSDYTANYPFALCSYTRPTWSFTTVYTQWMNFPVDYWGYSSNVLAKRDRQQGVVNMLHFRPLPKVELVLSETTVYNWGDSASIHQPPADYFLPLPFVRTLAHGLHGGQNVALGLSIQYSPARFVEFYHQSLLDAAPSDGSSARYGFQFGVRHLDLFRGRSPFFALYMQAEYNRISPGTWSGDRLRGAFAHLNLELGHPLGAGFSEILVRTMLKIWVFDLSLRYHQFNLDQPLYEVGNNVLTGGTVASGASRARLNCLFAEVALPINPAWNMSAFLGLTQRQYTVESETSATVIQLGLRSGWHRSSYHF